MVWRDLLARLVPGRGTSEAEAFLDALIAAQVAWRRAHAADLSVVRRIRQAEGHGRPPPADALAWWDDLRGGLLRRFPDADALALRWLCDIAGREERVLHAARELHARHLWDVSPLGAWVTGPPGEVRMRGAGWSSPWSTAACTEVGGWERAAGVGWQGQQSGGGRTGIR